MPLAFRCLPVLAASPTLRAQYCGEGSGFILMSIPVQEMVYVDAILRNGFDDIETLAEMREEHMKSMGFLPGHALKLKKRLREFIGEEAPSTVKTVSEPSNVTRTSRRRTRSQCSRAGRRCGS
ncbi:unnamed protein product [Durusdinium trenchii]|uniref:SAM domain-containing protein n=1 Tax=Durusdinium trenchii TaxID=1381693 RepID=A0ABP0JM12_9DINO